MRLRSVDGNYHNFISRANPLRDSDGHIEKWYGINLDITRLRQLEEQLNNNARFIQSAFDALQAHIAVLNHAGEIVAVNQAWKDFAAHNPPVEGNVFEGANYLAVCDGVPADSPDFPVAQSTARGIRAVIQGDLPVFTLEYPCDSPAERRWFDLKVNRLSAKESQYVIIAHEDITQVKLAEEQLRLFFDLVPDMVVIASTDGYFKSINAAWQRALGYSPAEMLNKPFLEFVHPEDRENTLNEVARQVNGESVIEFTNRYIAKDGSIHWLEWYASPSRDGASLYAAARDITRSKMAQDSLRKVQQDLLKYADQVPGMLYRLEVSPDGKMRIPLVSKGIYDLFGLYPEQVHDDFLPLQNRIHPDDLPQVMELMAASIDTGQPYHHVFRVQVPDQLLRWAWAQAVIDRLPDGSTAFQGLVMDVTARVTAESALRDSEVKFASMFRLSPVAINIFRAADGISVEVNDAFLELTGYTREEIQMHTAEELNLFVNPQDRLAWMQELKHGGVVRNVSTYLRKKSGAIRYTMASLAAFQNAGELHVIVLAVDLTALKQTEAALMLAQSELEKRVDERTSELRSELHARLSAESALEQERDSLFQRVEERTADLNRVNLDLNQEIENRKKFQAELERLATTDSLTGVFNRRHFMTLSETELEKSIRYNHPLSIILLDVDHFKSINDVHGHLTGDQILKGVVAAIRSQVRQVDVLARYGGEEFVILLPETDLATAHAIAERIRCAVEQQDFHVEELPLQITISLGVSDLQSCPSPVQINALLANADAALYLAKHGRRNRVCLYQPD